MKVIGFIPARMNSSRFYGKPLAPICGRTMIEHVYRRSKLCLSLTDLYVATCDNAIQEATLAFGGKVVMTSATHQRCTDRIAEAASYVANAGDIVVNIQGDEPLVRPEMIDIAVQALAEATEVEAVNLAAKLTDSEAQNPNEIKMVLDQKQNVLYFSRAAIPSMIKAEREMNYLKQVCIIAFRSHFLKTFTQLSPTPLECAESIDMLRAIEHGYCVRAVITSYETWSVDTPEDLLIVEEMMHNDELFKQMYSHTNSKTV